MSNPNSINYFYTDFILAKILLVIFNLYPGYNYIKIYSDLVFYSGSRFEMEKKMFVKGVPLKYS